MILTRKPNRIVDFRDNLLATPPVTVEVCSPDDFAFVVDEFLWRAKMIAQIVVALAIRQLSQWSTVIRVRNIGKRPYVSTVPSHPGFCGDVAVCGAVRSFRSCSYLGNASPRASVH